MDIDMLHGNRIAVIVPALNEAPVIYEVVTELLQLTDGQEPLIDELIVADNGSSDQTAKLACKAGASVILESRRGYGYACLAGLSALALHKPLPDVVIFYNADRSEAPEDILNVAAPVASRNSDLCVGVRHEWEPGGLKSQQRFGNYLVSSLVESLWGQRCSDFGPLRAIRYQKLCELDMFDTNYGWKTEMQVKAIQRDMQVQEVPVTALKNRTRSRQSGTVGGIIGSAIKMFGWVFYLAAKETLLRRRRRPSMAKSISTT